MGASLTSFSSTRCLGCFVKICKKMDDPGEFPRFACLQKTSTLGPVTGSPEPRLSLLLHPRQREGQDLEEVDII